MTSMTDAFGRLPPAVQRLGDRLLEWAATSGMRIVFVLAAALVALRLLRRFSRRLNARFADDRFSEGAKRAETVASVIRTVGGVVILLGAAMMILNDIGLNVQPLIATAGLGGLAIGFGAQSLVKDVITGFFLLAEDDIRVGDIVRVADKEGIVETAGLRSLRIRDVDGTVHTIPNSSVTIVSNMTRGFSRYVVDIPISANVDPRKAFAVLKSVDEELRSDPNLSRDIVEPLEILGLESPAKEPVVKVRITTRPRRQWVVGRRLNLQIRQKFVEAGIELR
jgi:small-conductance mechanosensitive channel